MHLPTYVLQLAFFRVRPTTALIAAAITVGAAALPFVLWRKRQWTDDQPHDGENDNDNKSTTFTSTSSNRLSSRVRNHPILADRQTTFYTTAAPALVYALALHASLASWLPAFLAARAARSVPDLDAAAAGHITHAGRLGLWTLGGGVVLVACALAGVAAREVLFVGALRLGEQRDAGEGGREETEADGKTAKTANMDAKINGEMNGNVGADKEEEEKRSDEKNKKANRPLFPSKFRVLYARTALATAAVAAATVADVTLTMPALRVAAAGGWAVVWAGATMVVGGLYAWVLGVDGV